MPRRKLDTPRSQFTRALAALWNAMAEAGLSPAETIAEWVWPSEDPERKAWTVYKWKEGTRFPTDWEQVWRLDEMAQAAGFTQFTASRCGRAAPEGVGESLVDEALDGAELSGKLASLARQPIRAIADGDLSQAAHLSRILTVKLEGEVLRRANGETEAFLSDVGGIAGDGGKTRARI